MKGLKKYLLSMGLVVFMLFNCVYVFAADNLEIIHEDGLLTVSVEDAMPENIFMELGRECNIDIIAHGEVFPQKDVTIKLKDMPIKDAVKRLVRVCALKNYLMDFKKDSEGESRLVKIDLYMGGSGQRVLTTGKEISAKKTRVEKNNKKSVKSTASSSRRNKNNKNKRPYKSSFAKDTDFQWDGSAPIAFPEYEEKLPFDQSSIPWDEDAQSFADGTMDLVPPGVRDMAGEQITKMAEQIAKEEGVDTVTSDIVAKALQIIGKDLPQNVRDLLPKTPGDLDQEKIEVDPGQLSGE